MLNVNFGLSQFARKNIQYRIIRANKFNNQWVSDGGPDDPRWVAAVCPNCHKEVHYGISGDELNQKLADKLGIIEASI